EPIPVYDQPVCVILSERRNHEEGSPIAYTWGLPMFHTMASETDGWPIQRKPLERYPMLKVVFLIVVTWFCLGTVISYPAVGTDKSKTPPALNFTMKS